MRLLYLYCKSLTDAFKEPLDSLDLNFDSEWRFRFTNGTLYVTHDKPLPRHFFSDTDGKINVSVVVGCNGAGKTSIARMFHRLSLGDQNLASIVVSEDGGEFIIAVSQIDVSIKPSPKSCDTATQSVVESLNAHGHNIAGYKLLEQLFKFVYYSPVYTSQHQMDIVPKAPREDFPRFFYDISTSGLMRHPNRFHVGRDAFTQENWARFESEDAAMVWRFLCGMRIQMRKDKIAGDRKKRKRHITEELVPPIYAIRVSINKAALSFYESEYRGKLEKYQQRYTGVQTQVLPRLRATKDELIHPEEKFCQRIVSLFDRQNDFVTFGAKVLFAYAVCYFYDADVGINGEPRIPDECLISLLEQIADSRSSDEVMIKMVSNYIGDANARGMALSKQRDLPQFLILLSKLNYEPIGGHVVKAIKPGDAIPALLLIELHQGLKTLTDFLIFSPLPKLAAGEWSIFSMLSRIYAVRAKLNDRPVVLFLDEAETTLHPDKQRMLVAGMIDFCEQYLPDNNIHIIFATHSPQLLSDIPVGNALLLQRKNDGSRVIVEGSDNTFGANIYDLYKDGFFMPNGPVGVFATRKISSTLKSVSINDSRKEDVGCNLHEQTHRMTKDEIAEMADIIGDRVLRGYFLRLRTLGLL